MALRDLLVSIKIKTDTSGIKTVNAEVQKATSRVRSWETKLQGAFGGLKSRFVGAANDMGASLVKTGQQTQGLAKRLLDARTAFAGFAAVIVGREIADFFGSVVEAGGALSEMSQRTRVSAESLQAWKQLAADNSIDAGVLESSFRKLSKSMRASEKDSSAQGKAFALLGVSAKNADGTGLRPVEDVMIDVGVALNKMEDDATATAIATQLLGPAGYGLVPAFEAGEAATRSYLKTAKEMASISQSEAARLDEVGDATERGIKRWKGLKDRVVIAVLPALEWLSVKFEKISTWLFRVARDTQAFQTIALALAGGGLYRLVALFAAWVAKTGGMRAAMAVISGGLRTIASFALRTILPLLVIEDFLTFLAGGKSVFGRVFNEIFGEGGAAKVRAGILNAFQSIQEVIGRIATALGGLVNNDLFKGAAAAALNGILTVLNLIGFALADNANKANKMAAALGQTKEKAAEAVGVKLGHKASDAAPTAEKGNTRPDGTTDYSTPTGTFLDKVPGGKWLGNHLRGAALSDPKVAAEYAKNNAQTQSIGVVPPAAVSSSSAAPAGKSITIQDNRTLKIDVSGGATPGATGRAVSGAASQALDTDRRQTLSAVSG